MKQVAAEELDDFLGARHGPFLQSSRWAGFQNGFGRRSWFLRLGRGMGSVVRFELPFGKNYLYVPKGPVGVEHWADASNTLRELALQERSIFFRVDPEIGKGETDLAKFGFRKSPKETQPKQTILIDLSKPLEQLLAEMHTKTRYNIKLGEKKELRIANYGSSKDFDIVWTLFQETAKRDKFYLHPKVYYEKMLELPEARLYTVHHKEQIIAAAIVSFFAGKCVYLHGASDHEFRQLMAPYFLHWQIIKSGKQAGMQEYDLGGVAPKSEQNHSWAGITRFKSGFGGKYVEYMGSWDYAMDKIWYGTYKLARFFF